MGTLAWWMLRDVNQPSEGLVSGGLYGALREGDFDRKLSPP